MLDHLETTDINNIEESLQYVKGCQMMSNSIRFASDAISTAIAGLGFNT